MSTYDISGLDWQTAHNNSTAAPSCRESDGMTDAVPTAGRPGRVRPQL